MTARTIHVETELPTSAERVWAAMKHPASFLYVTHESLGESRCRYSDTVAIDAGPLTRLVAVAATGIFRHRQRRWHRLVRKHLLPTGPRYGHQPTTPTGDTASSTGTTAIGT